MGGRPRNSLVQAALNGALAKNPARYMARLEGEPVPTGEIGAAPAHLSESERQIWDEITDVALPGALGNSDRFAVEIACRLLSRMRDTTLSIKTSEVSLLVATLGKLGLTPLDRTKLNVAPQEKKKPDDPWSQF